MRRTLAVATQVFWRNKRTFFAITLLTMLPVGGVSHHLQPMLAENLKTNSWLVSQYIHVIEVLLATSLLKGALSHGVFCALSGGHITLRTLRENTDFIKVWRAAVRIAVYCLINNVVIGLCLLALVAIPIFTISGGIPEFLAAIAMLIIIRTLVLFSTRYFIVVAVSTIENKGILDSFRRSRSLASGHMLGIARVLFLVILGAGVVVLVAEVVDCNLVRVGGESAPYQVISLALAGLLAATDGIVTTVCYVFLRFKSFYVPTDAFLSRPSDG